jgi:hypothetical protein
MWRGSQATENKKKDLKNKKKDLLKRKSPVDNHRKSVHL